MKLGSADYEILVALEPGMTAVQKDLETFQVKLKEDLDRREKEITTLQDAHQKTSATMAPAVRDGKEKEIEKKIADYRKAYDDARTKLNTKQNDAMKPVIERVNKAIDEVKTANGYAYILKPDSFVPFNESNDITNQVLVKMGIKDPEAAIKKLEQQLYEQQMQQQQMQQQMQQQQMQQQQQQQPAATNPPARRN